MPIDILFVCTGNICRSPLMEYHLKRDALQLGLQLSISSAGTHAMLGHNVPDEISSQGRAWGVDMNGHQPSQLNQALIERSVLILTAERSHRAEVVSLLPSAAKKTYTLKQFERVACAYFLAIERGEEFPPKSKDFRAYISEIADYRALTPPPLMPEEDDIADPFRRRQAAYDRAAEEIDESIESLLPLLQKATLKQ